MTATLPVSSLVGANLAWARQDFGPMPELIADIKKHGIRQPVLIRPDYLVLDGARRLVAAARLKITYAPIIICTTWEQLKEHYHPTEDAYPMNWIEIRDLVVNTLRPVYQEYRFRQAAIKRDTQAGQPHPGRRIYSYSGFTVACAELFNVQPVHMKMLNEYVKRLLELKATEPALAKDLSAAIAGMPPELRRHLPHVRILKAVLDQHIPGTTSPLVTTELMTAQLAAALAPVPLSTARTHRNRLDSEAPPVPLGVIRNYAEMLQTLCQQATGFRNFKITTKHQTEEFLRVLQMITASTGPLYQLRRRMEQVVPANQIPGTEEDKESSA